MQPNPSCDQLVRAGVLLTQDAKRTVIYDAGLALSQGLVQDVGPWAEVSSRNKAQTTLDLSGSLVMPGLVNTHTHAPMTAFRGLADDLPLMDWLTNHIWPVENRLTPEIIYSGAILGCAEMLSTGSTCFADMYLFEPEVARATEQMGMRAVLGEGVMSFATRSYDTPDEAFEYIEDFTRTVAGSPLVRTAVAPHAAYTTTPEILQQSFELATRLDIIWMIHAAENADETALCLEKFGKRPIPYLNDLGCLTDRTLLVHMVDETPQETELVAKSGASVSHNPRSNMKLANGFCPAQLLLDKGVTVGLGTDGPGSNNAMNMFQEMNAAALLQKVHRLDPTVMNAQTVLDCATLGGAKALGWDGLGALTPGCAADLTALDLDHPGLVPLYHPASQIVYAATGAEVTLTMVAGKTVFENGKFMAIEQRELHEHATRLKAWAASG